MSTFNIITTEFLEPDRERAFREESQGHDRFQNTIGMGLFVLTVLVFAYNDFLFYGASSFATTLLAARILFFLVSGTFIFIMFKTDRYQVHEKLVLAWLFSYALLVTYIEPTRPPMQVLPINLFILCMIYIYFQIPLKFQLLSGLMWTAACAVTIVFFKGPLDPTQISILVLAATVGNTMPAIASWRAQRNQRHQFDVQTQLRSSLHEVKTLSGLLPICASCKDIRDDDGYWNQIEAYITKRSAAQFSHGICPKCAKKLYPEYDLE